MSDVSNHYASGARVTRMVESLDAVDAELAAFVRTTALLLDPSFPQSGTRGPKQKGQWKDDEQRTTLMHLVQEFDSQKRGLELVRMVTPRVPGEPHEGAFRVTAVGLPTGVELEIWWDTITSWTEVRGVGMRMSVAGAGKEACIAAFLDCFGLPGA